MVSLTSIYLSNPSRMPTQFGPDGQRNMFRRPLASSAGMPSSHHLIAQVVLEAVEHPTQTRNPIFKCIHPLYLGYEMLCDRST